MASLLPLAGAAQPVNPERLNGSFDFVDRDEGPNNQLEFVVEDDRNSLTGVVTGLSGTDIVRITYWTMFPNKFAANERSAALQQDRQVTVQLELIPGMGSLTPAYVGDASPGECRVKAKIRDNEINDPDDPDKSDASLRCDLGSDFSKLDDDDEPLTPGDPPQLVLDALDAAFATRKDVKVRIGNGILQIKHKGEGVVEE